MFKKNRGNGEKGNKERIKERERGRKRENLSLLTFSSQAEVHIFSNAQTQPRLIKLESLQVGPGHLSLPLLLF